MYNYTVTISLACVTNALYHDICLSSKGRGVIICNFLFSSPSYVMAEPGTSHTHNYIPTQQPPVGDSDVSSNESSLKEKHLQGHRMTYRKMKRAEKYEADTTYERNERY